MSNSYFDAEEFAEQAAKPMRATLIMGCGMVAAIVPPCATQDDLQAIKNSIDRTRRLQDNCGKGMRS